MTSNKTSNTPTGPRFMSQFLTRRNGTWHFVRRVPLEFTALDTRGVIKQSTKVRISDDRSGVKASAVANQMNDVLEAYWKGLVEGKAAEAEERYENARNRARSMGFDYVPAAKVADAVLDDVLARLERIAAEGATGASESERATQAALLGGEAKPSIMISDLFSKFEEQVAAELTDLSKDQRRKWGNPKKRAMNNLLEVIGDKPITEITDDEALDFSEWWGDRIIDEGLHPDTANKDMGHIDRMVFVVNKRFRLGLKARIFTGMRIEGGVENTRPPFDPAYVRKHFLVPGALNGLNEQARAAFYVIMGTGLRPSEAVNLNKTTIFLQTNIPYVTVMPDGRRMKTPQSQREVPLVGIALEAIRRFPKGFPQYRDKSATLSATINKFLKENKLRQGGDRTVYSLRHMFKDQLTNDAHAEDSMIDALMGHKETGSKYGRGPSMQLKLKALHRIAFNVPADFSL